MTMMDTSILIQFIEAERSTIDPKHRSLECDMLAYGIINRVLKGIYEEKRRNERAMEALQADLNAPESPATEKPGKKAAAKPNPYNHPREINRREDGQYDVRCMMCGSWVVSKSPAVKMCTSKECRADYVKRKNASRFAPKQPVQALEQRTSDGHRTCLNCGKAFIPKKTSTQFVCGSDNRACKRGVLHKYHRVTSVRNKMKRGIRTFTDKEREAVAFMNSVNEARGLPERIELTV